MNFISKKLIGITFLGLLIYLTFDFLQNKEEKFWQFNYDWEKIEILQDLGPAQVDSVQANYLEITIPNSIESIKANTLTLSKGQNRYYFNFENAYIKDHQVKFTGGFWVLNEPINAGAKVNTKLISLPLKQTGNTKINMITDSQLLWRGGRSFRKWLKEENNDLNFVGDRVDLFGFPYTGEIVNTTHKTLANSDKIEEAAIYVISLGTHENQKQLSTTINNYKAIIESIKQRNNSAEIFIVNLPPSSNSDRNKYNKELNSELNNLAISKQIEIIDFYELMKSSSDKLLMQDQIHYQAKAYKILASHLNKQFDGSR